MLLPTLGAVVVAIRVQPATRFSTSPRPGEHAAQAVPVPGSEILCIFDADQVAKPEFFLRTVALFDSGDDVGMVLSPQCFHNLDYHTDIFNHSNRQFWEYMQPGYDAWGFISCTGALQQCHVAC